MTKDEYKKIDNTFNEAMFLTKINNMFIKIFSAITLDNLEEVKHFMSDEIYHQFAEALEQDKRNHERHMYDELNVKTSRLESIEKTESAYELTVILHSRYMDYYLSLETGEVTRGNNSCRIDVLYRLTFTKQKNVKKTNIVRQCPTCGASLDVDDSGFCPYCHSTYDQIKHDYVLTKIKVCS